MRQRKTITAAFLSIAMLGAGCQRQVAVQRGALNDTPLDVDQAMEIREWDRAVAYYENPRFIAGPTGFWWQSSYDRPGYQYYLLETPMFVLQTLGLPVTLALRPPWTRIEYAGETLDATWHAMPPLPPLRSVPPPRPFEILEDLEPRPETPATPPVRDPGPMTSPPFPLPTQPMTADPETQPGAAPSSPARRLGDSGAVEPRPGVAAPAERPRRLIPPAQPATRPSNLRTATPAPTTRPTTQPVRRDLNK